MDREALGDAASLADALSCSSHDQLRRSDLELLGERHWPCRHYTLLEPRDPGPEVAFLTVANSRFYRGLEALLLSLRAVYPRFTARMVVAHDGSLDRFLRRRLRGIQPGLEFVVPDASWADQLPVDSANRQRIGRLGYLNGHSLALRGYRRVVVLDADLLITGPLDPLWADGDDFRAVPDCGQRPWAAVSAATGRPVLNSGVLSLPAWALNDEFQNRFWALTRQAGLPACPLLDRFADQKVWNLLLAAQPVEMLPLNFNCNIKYLVQYLGGCPEGLSVIHFAGPKPWFTWPWVTPHPHDTRPGVVVDHLLWNRHYRQLLMPWRLRLHAEASAKAPPLPGGPAQLVCHPETLAAVPPGVSRHLVLGDPELLGRPWPEAPTWPQGWFEQLQLAAPLQIWAPFEWEPALRDLPLPEAVHWRWALIEAPFSPELEQGDDLIADRPPWAGGFQAWSEPGWIGVARVAQRCLESHRAGPVEFPHP